MKKMNRILSAILALCMLLSLMPTVLAEDTVNVQQGVDLEITKVDSHEADLKTGVETDTLESEGYDAEDMVTVIVVLEQKSLLDQNFSKRQIADNDSAMTAAKATIAAAQDKVLAQISAITGQKSQMGYRYSVIITGFSVDVPYGTLKEIEAMDGVRAAFVAPTYAVPEDYTDDAQTNTYATTNSFGSALTWQTMGYTGAGMRIAILDTGLDVDHPSFTDAPELTATSLTPEEVGSVLTELNAYARYAEATGEELKLENVYYNQKVPFGFNYGSDSLDISHDNDSVGDHGTHVAGIAAANAIESTDVVGVAPDAQILAMKVFQSTGSASFADIVAALEDCYRLNVDAINMSLGADAGFTTVGDEIWDEIFGKIEENDMVAAVSAGNAGSAADYNAYGTDLNLTSDPDNGIVSSPATWRGTTMVASLENSSTRVNYFTVGDASIAYSDANSDGSTTPAFASLAGTVEYVMVPGFGSEEDFASVNAEGRVAVVSRGDLAFTDKQTNAYNAGAVGCIVYDNAEGDLIYMQDAGLLPNAFISMADGALMAEASTNGVGTMEIRPADDLIVMENATGGQMSSFSSWGVTPDLQLEPDVTAPGGYIYSSVNNGQYGIMSGTSMSAPHIAGMAALVLQYLHEEHSELTDAQMHTVAEALIMSTATPVMEQEGVAYSPRKQGAGSANVYDAILSDGYLTVNGSTPKVSMGDDDDRSGSYTFTFEINNFSDRALSYELDASLLTDQVNTDYSDYGYLFMGETSKALSSEPMFYVQQGGIAEIYDVNGDGVCDLKDAQYVLDVVTGVETASENAGLDVNGDGVTDTLDAQIIFDAVSSGLTESNVVMVNAGESLTVTVSIQLNDADVAYINKYYPNGIYVEGFVRCYALDEENSDLSLPFMGFYGDWSSARVFDGGWYYDENPEYNRYLNCLWTNYGAYYNYFGMNGYVSNEAYDPSHNVISPNDDAYNDTINDMYLSLMRGAKSLSITFTDDATGEILSENVAEWVRKTYYVTSAGVNYPFLLTDYFDEDEIYDFTDSEGNYLANNTKVTLTISACLDDGDDVADETITVPITIDTEAPELLRARKMIDAETGEPTYLELTFRDNVATAAVALLNGDGTMVYGLESVEDPAADEDGSRTYTVTFDVSGMDSKVMVVLADYGMNEANYGINLGGKGASFGALVAYQYDYDTNVNGWVSFNADVNADETAIFGSSVDFVCAEYVNGFVFAQTDSGALYGFAYDSMLGDLSALEPIFIKQLDRVYQDLAYSYAEGKLYGLHTSEYEGYPTAEIYSINLNGEYYDSSLWATVPAYGENWTLNRGGVYGLSMAIDDAGTIYVLGHNYDWDTEDLTETAHLWSVGMEYNEWYDRYEIGSAMSEIGDTGLSMNYLQSMTWDHNAEKLYWAHFDVNNMKPVSNLMEVNTETAECTQIGTLSGETCALFAPLTAESAVKEAHTNLPEMDSSIIGTPVLRDSNVSMNLGGTKQFVCEFDPWYSAHKTVTWSSDNSAVVTVDENGFATAVAEGEATITATNVEDETKQASCVVLVTALDLELEGIYTTQTAGTGSTGGVSFYHYSMKDGVASFEPGDAVTIPEDLNFGSEIVSSTYGRGSIWACEIGNAGMIYEIDPETGVAKDVLEPVDGDHLYGLAYSEKLDSFNAIMDMYLYVDLPMTSDIYEEMQNSYDSELNEFMWHKLNMLPYLIESNDGFVTGEDGNGASSEIVFSGITILDNQRPNEMYSDYLGNGYDNAMYTSTQTIVLMDNVGRLWYVDEITDMAYYADDWGNAYYVNADYATEGTTMMISAGMNGVESVEYTDTEGNKSYNVFVISEIVETPLTDMYRDGTMPRITYTFSDLTYAGKTAEGADMFIMSLYDYWNNGTTNELYLYVAGVGTGEMAWDDNWNMYEIKTPDQLYSLGNTGEHNIIATVNRATVNGGVGGTLSEETETQSLAIGAYTRLAR